MDEGYLRTGTNENEQASIFLRVSDQGTRCFLSAPARPQDSPLSSEDLTQQLAERQVSLGVNPEAVTAVCQKINAGAAVQDILIAEGKLPEAGADGAFDFHIKPFSLTPDFNENSLGSVDYHETNLFENVSEGQVIGMLKTPVPGRSGFMVSGDIIPAPPVERLLVKGGSGVSCSEDGLVFTAARSGRVIFSQNILSVSEEFVVERDVDFGVGNIEFVGVVQVRGDVLDGFRIQAKKGIQVAGNVGGSALESDGDITLGGMTGRENEGSIRCGGNFTAHYLNNARIECEGNVVIHKECVNSVIKCNGTLTVGGRLVGGECAALAGIEAEQIGTEMGVKTILVSGYDYHTVGQIQELQDLLDTIELNLAGQLKKLEPLTIDTDPETLPQDARRTFQHKLFEIEKNRNKRKDMLDILDSLRQDNAEQASAKINIHKYLYPGTTLTLDLLKKEIKETVKGPCSAIALSSQELMFVEFTPLAKKTGIQVHYTFKSNADPEPAPKTAQA